MCNGDKAAKPHWRTVLVSFSIFRSLSLSHQLGNGKSPKTLKRCERTEVKMSNKMRRRWRGTRRKKTKKQSHVWYRLLGLPASERRRGGSVSVGPKGHLISLQTIFSVRNVWNHSPTVSGLWRYSFLIKQGGGYLLRLLMKRLFDTPAKSNTSDDTKQKIYGVCMKSWLQESFCTTAECKSTQCVPVWLKLKRNAAAATMRPLSKI